MFQWDFWNHQCGCSDICVSWGLIGGVWIPLCPFGYNQMIQLLGATKGWRSDILCGCRMPVATVFFLKILTLHFIYLPHWDCNVVWCVECKRWGIVYSIYYVHSIIINYKYIQSKRFHDRFIWIHIRLVFFNISTCNARSSLNVFHFL